MVNVPCVLLGCALSDNKVFDSVLLFRGIHILGDLCMRMSATKLEVVEVSSI